MPRMDDYVEGDSEKESDESNDSADKASRGLSCEWKGKAIVNSGAKKNSKLHYQGKTSTSRKI